MNKTSRWAAIVGVVCGAELVAIAIIGGAGIAALLSIEAAIVVALLGAASIWTMLDRHRRNAKSSKSRWTASANAPKRAGSSPGATEEPDPTDASSDNSHSHPTAPLGTTQEASSSKHP